MTDSLEAAVGERIAGDVLDVVERQARDLMETRRMTESMAGDAILRLVTFYRERTAPEAKRAGTPSDLPTLLWCPACEGGYVLDRVVAYTKNLPGDRLCACCMTVWHKGSVPSEFFEFEQAAPSLPVAPVDAATDCDEHEP